MIHEIPKPTPDDFLVVACSQCKARNKVNRARVDARVICGKCGHPLALQA